MPRRLRVRTVGAIAGAALAAASGAWAHGGTRSTGYVSTFSNLEPNVLGITVNIFGRDNTISLSNLSGKKVVVLGSTGKPYLRFARNRVDENLRAADPAARPHWRKVATGPSYAWHDHRIVWTGNEKPAVVRRAPREPHLVFRWALRATADGKPFLIKGFLGWAPTPEPKGDGTSTWVYAAIGGAGIAALAALVLGLRARRARRRAL
jgi:hypothetical protein